jgi:hypothetical protein
MPPHAEPAVNSFHKIDQGSGDRPGVRRSARGQEIDQASGDRPGVNGIVRGEKDRSDDYRSGQATLDRPGYRAPDECTLPADAPKIPFSAAAGSPIVKLHHSHRLTRASPLFSLRDPPGYRPRPHATGLTTDCQAIRQKLWLMSIFLEGDYLTD